ncbi:MAG: hypothetical protein SGPRY_014083 [Prymnesium sp.]
MRALERRVRDLEVISHQQSTALEWLTRRTDCLSQPQPLNSEVRKASTAPSKAAPSTPPTCTSAGQKPVQAARRSGREAGSLHRGNSWESMSETGGYKTAEEDVEGGDAASSGLPNRAAVQVESLPASPAWGAESTWSCVSTSGGVDGAPSLPVSVADGKVVKEKTRGASLDQQPATINGDICEGTAEGWAAVGDETRDPSREGMESVLQRADDLYKKRSFTDAYALLASAPRTAETLWRQARTCKALADQAKHTGEKVCCG